MFDFLDDASNLLWKENIKIQDYTLRQYYKISYMNYKGDRKEQLFEPQNNYNHILYGKRLRYCKDTELCKVKGIPVANIELPLDVNSSIKGVTINHEIYRTNTGLYEVAKNSKAIIKNENESVIGYSVKRPNRVVKVVVVTVVITLILIVMGVLVACFRYFWKDKRKFALRYGKR